MTSLLVVGALFGGTFFICGLLWFVAAISGQVSQSEEDAGIARRS